MRGQTPRALLCFSRCFGDSGGPILYDSTDVRRGAEDDAELGLFLL
jgi:hypothetical protein